jgi:hypothetical protein
MSVEEIVGFVRARLGEREQAAQASTPGPWRYNPRQQWHTPAEIAGGLAGEEFVGAGPRDATVGVAATGPADHPQSMVDASFIAGNDPTFVLADIDAKRRRLDWIEERLAAGDGEPAGWLLRVEALPYARHPDYRSAWRP